MQLHDSVLTLPGIGPKKAEELLELEISTLGDLLNHIPFRYEDATEVVPLNQLEVGRLVTVEAEVLSVRAFRTRSRVPMVQATIMDSNGDELTLTFFHQPYVAKQLKAGENYAFTGKVGEFRNQLTLTNPNYEPLEKEHRVHTGRVLPIYSQHKSISSVWLRRTVPALLSQQALLPQEYIDESLRKENNLFERSEAWKKIHIPESMEDTRQARRRIAFDELWEIFNVLATEQALRQQYPARTSVSQEEAKSFLQEFTQALPFPLTASQQMAVNNLIEQFTANVPFRQFIQGEVGSGKTFVAAFALMLTARSGGQALYIVPTTVLAEQHFQSLQPLAHQLNLELALWTGSNKGSSEADVVIGTHAFLHHAEKFSPDIVVIDEEHRFGVQQRDFVWNKERPPHFLTMTATPIPRTLAHVLYGDHQVSFLEPIPGKERAIITRVFPVTKLEAHFEWLAEKVKNEEQAFVITPLIEPSETELFADVYDATSTYKRIQKAFPKLQVGILTGRTPAGEKHKTLELMRQKKLDILVATPVIEVGIDIPDASVITILSAERFGFAQLHQLRGRVGRKGQDGWCFLVPSPGKEAQRLRLLETTHDGHALAELDLQNRGAGEFLGTRQTGWDGLQVATWMDLPLIELVKKLHSIHGRLSPQESELLS